MLNQSKILNLPIRDVTIVLEVDSCSRNVLTVQVVSFLCIFEFRPFNSVNYEDEFSDDEVLDEEGRARLKLRVYLS